MPDDEQKIYILPNNGTGWQTGNVITADKMNDIGKVLHYTSEEIANATKSEHTIENTPNNILQKKLENMVKYFNEPPQRDSDLQYTRLYAEASTGNNIIVPTQEQYLKFKNVFVSPFDKTKNYQSGEYIQYNDQVYKVISTITANNSATDNAAWEAINNKINKINVMQEIANLITFYTEDSQLNQAVKNRFYIKNQNEEAIQLPTLEEFNELKQTINNYTPNGIDTSDAHIGQIPMVNNENTIQWQYPTKHYPPNSEDAVTRMGNVALSYISHQDEFIYGGIYSAIRDECKPDPETGKWQIACSIFVILLLYGISYENSAYQRGTGNNIFDPDFCTDYEMWDWFTTKWPDKTGDYQYKYSYDLGQWCYEHGYAFEPNEDLSNIKPGDLLFFKNVLSYEPTQGFMDIEHTAIFAYWESDGLMRVWEVGSLPSLGSYLVSHLKAPDDNTIPHSERKPKIVLAARFPFTTKDTERKCVSYCPGGAMVSGNSTITYIQKTKLIPYRYYTFTVKMTWDQAINDAWPAIYQGNNRLGTYDAALSKPEDDIYIIPFVPTDTIDLNLRLLFNPNSDVRQANSRVEWYQIVEGIHFSRDKMSTDRYINILLNTGFTNDANSRDGDRLIYGVNGTFPPGVTTVGTVLYLIRHGPFVPLANTTFADGEPVDGITAYLDYTDTQHCYLKVKNSTDASVTGKMFCIIPVYTY